MSDTYPYDQQDFDAGLVALLGRLRQEPVAEVDEDESEELERLEAAMSSMPAPAKALVHTAIRHGVYLDIGWFELQTFESMEDFGDDDFSEAFAEAGWVEEHSVQIGASGGGEVQLFLAWKNGEYAVVQWDMVEEGLKFFSDFGAFFYAVAASECYDHEVAVDDLNENLKGFLVATRQWDTFKAEN